MTRRRDRGRKRRAYSSAACPVCHREDKHQPGCVTLAGGHGDQVINYWFGEPKTEDGWMDGAKRLVWDGIRS